MKNSENRELIAAVKRARAARILHRELCQRRDAAEKVLREAHTAVEVANTAKAKAYEALWTIVEGPQ